MKKWKLISGMNGAPIVSNGPHLKDGEIIEVIETNNYEEILKKMDEMECRTIGLVHEYALPMKIINGLKYDVEKLTEQNKIMREALEARKRLENCADEAEYDANYEDVYRLEAKALAKCGDSDSTAKRADVGIVGEINLHMRDENIRLKENERIMRKAMRYHSCIDQDDMLEKALEQCSSGTTAQQEADDIYPILPPDEK